MRKTLHLVTLFLLFGSAVWSQSSIMGFVKDQSGSSVPFATIKVKGARITTVADANGSFKIAAPANSKLVVTAVGYTQAEADAADNVTVVLQTSTSSLTDVVVTGTGVATSKKRLGISVEAVTADKLPPIPAASLDQALVGKIPGAQISTISGNPGDKVNIVLRGINTVQGGTRPLILLDGVEIPFEDLNTIDLTQVERVEVVQGAASATIYGAQGANGVIQIFTKKGTKGKMTINVSSSISRNSFINSDNFGKANMHSYLTDAKGNIVAQGTNTNLGYSAGDPLKVDPTLGYVLGSNSLSYKYGANVVNADLPDPSIIPGLTDNYTRYGILDPRNQYNEPYAGSLKYNNQIDEVFRTAYSRNNSINLNGGGEKSDFSVTMSNNHTNSPLLKNNGYLDRTNVTLNLGFEVFKNFTFRAITNLAYSRNTMHPRLGAPGEESFGNGDANADVGGVYGFLNTSPFFNLEDTITGGYYASFLPASFASVNSFNPYYRLEYTKADSKRYDLIQDFEANYNVNKFVTLNAKYGVSYKNENDVWTIYNQTQNANTEDQDSYSSWYTTDEKGEIDNWQYNNTKQNFLGTANIKTDFQKDFNINIPLQTNTLLGFDYRNNKYKELDTWGQALPLNPPFSLSTTQSQHTSLDFIEPFVTYGYLLDQKFDIGNYGGVTGGFRTDYSSAFGEGHKPFTFPHFNGYLNLNSFNFWNNLSNTIPSFKLRAAYGKAGIQPSPFDRYPTLIPQPTGNTLTYTNRVLAKNPDLNVEVSSETEFGTDLSFKLSQGNWFRFLNISATYWKRHTDNAIFQQNVPPSTGATQLLTNAIKLHSHGWQVAVNIPIASTKNFTWDFTVNLGHQESIVDSVTGGDIPLLSGAGDAGLAIASHRKIGEIYGYKALTSIDQVRADGKTPFIDPSTQGNYEIVNGRVVNKITKAIFFSDEAVSFGDPNPKLTSSFISTMTFKKTISLGFQFDWIYGSHLYDQTDEWMYRDGISKDFDKPVTINGQTGAWTAYYASAYYALGNTAKGVGNDATKDFFYDNASFLRLRNVSLGVDFSTFAKQEWLKKCQLVFSGRNLWTVTKYPGFDPEISSGSSNSSFDRGIDHNTIPNLKSYQVTLNLTF